MKGKIYSHFKGEKMKLDNVPTKELFLELIKRPEVLDIARAYGFGAELNTAFDSYEIEFNFHLSDEEWNKHFQEGGV